MNETTVSIETRYGDAPIFVFADHASNAIPADYNDLGLPEDVLETHIAWDIGAGALATRIAETLNGTLFTCTYSRLIIDPNRSLATKDLIPATSDQIPIPGNQMLSEAERKERIERLYVPYHNQLAASIDAFTPRAPLPFVVSVHSFTKRMMGAVEDRPWNVGMLWRQDEASANTVIEWLRKNTDWAIGSNEPYDAREFNYSIDRHVGAKDIKHLTFEVRQDMLMSDQSVDSVAAALSEAIAHTAMEAINHVADETGKQPLI
ncbi:MAG: N-formylglutamate amidohydrolase [Pseudomonadota bacterium]